MRIETKGTALIITSALQEYIEKKFKGLERFVKRYEKQGEVRLHLEVARTTKHHRHGPVFYAEAMLYVGNNVLRAEKTSEDARSAIDGAKDILKQELLRYKEKQSNS